MGVGSTVYNLVLAFHILAVISWMAGMLYLPRLFVYHSVAPVGSPQAETFKVMEGRLLRGIMVPAMIAVWVLGLTLAWLGGWESAGWLMAKFVLVILLSAIHGYFVGRVRAFAENKNTRPQRFYRMINEVPTVIMIGIVLLVVLKPF